MNTEDCWVMGDDRIAVFIVLIVLPIFFLPDSKKIENDF